MKNKKIIALSILGNILLLLIICTLISENVNIIREKQVVKEMTEGEYESKITELNTSHEDYMNYIQTCKTEIATAITNEGVETSNEETLETMAENISKILETRADDATEIMSSFKQIYYSRDSVTSGSTRIHKYTIPSDGIYLIVFGLNENKSPSIYGVSTSYLSNSGGGWNIQIGYCNEGDVITFSNGAATRYQYVYQLQLD